MGKGSQIATNMVPTMFGAMFKIYLDQKDINASDCARLCGVSVKTVTCWTQGIWLDLEVLLLIQERTGFEIFHPDIFNELKRFS